MENKVSTERVAYILQGAELNDTLLQSYRSFHLTLQSIFLAIGSGLLIAILALDNLLQSLITTMVLMAIGSVSIYILLRMHNIIIARGKDVNFWHQKLIKAEQELPPEQRVFTQFKIHQKMHRTNTDYLNELFLAPHRKITDEEIGLLVERGLGHTRRVLDKWLFIGIGIIWTLLLATSICYMMITYF